jgi:hypothetical protein
MKPVTIVIMRTPSYNRTGPDSFDHYVRETLGLVVAVNSDGTVDLQEVKSTHAGYVIDERGNEQRSVRTLTELDFPTWGRRVDT